MPLSYTQYVSLLLVGENACAPENTSWKRRYFFTDFLSAKCLIFKLKRLKNCNVFVFLLFFRFNCAWFATPLATFLAFQYIFLAGNIFKIYFFIFRFCRSMFLALETEFCNCYFCSSCSFLVSVNCIFTKILCFSFRKKENFILLRKEYNIILILTSKTNGHYFNEFIAYYQILWQ